MRLQGLTPERPLTHDLFAAALKELGVRVERVVIAALAEETYHARLVLERDGATFELDSRPSDAVALAVRTDGRIFASEAVLEQAALGADSELASAGDDDEGEPGTPLESLGETIVDPRLDMFRDFINSLDVEPGTQSSGGDERT